MTNSFMQFKVDCTCFSGDMMSKSRGRVEMISAFFEWNMLEESEVG